MTDIIIDYDAFAAYLREQAETERVFSAKGYWSCSCPLASYAREKLDIDGAMFNGHQFYTFGASGLYEKCKPLAELYIEFAHRIDTASKADNPMHPQITATDALAILEAIA
jgi:hypothetical protein